MTPFNIVAIILTLTLLFILVGIWTNLRMYRKGWMDCQKNARNSLQRWQWRGILKKL